MDFKKNVQESFKKAKGDIQELQREVAELKKSQQRLVLLLDARGYAKIVGSRESDTIHDERCAFAKRINPANKIDFLSKEQAAMHGFQACVCLDNV